jgi:hypothetical protein
MIRTEKFDSIVKEQEKKMLEKKTPEEITPEEQMKKYGIEILKIESYWILPYQSPVVYAKIKNVRDKDITTLKLKAQYYYKNTKEVFGNGTAYYIMNINIPMHTNEVIEQETFSVDKQYAKTNLPNLTAKLYFDIDIGDENYKNVYYKDIIVEKKYKESKK